MKICSYSTKFFLLIVFLITSSYISAFEKESIAGDLFDLSDGEIISHDGEFRFGEPVKISYSKDSIFCDSDIPEYYKEYLRQNSITDDYALIYIDSDTIPELILKGDWVEGQLILSKQKDTIVSLKTWKLGFSYIEKTGLCGYSCMHKGSIWDKYYKLENGDFENFIDFFADDLGYWDQDKEGLAQGRLIYNGNRVDCIKLKTILQKEYYDKGNVITTEIIKFKANNHSGD